MPGRQTRGCLPNAGRYAHVSNFVSVTISVFAPTYECTYEVETRYYSVRITILSEPAILWNIRERVHIHICMYKHTQKGWTQPDYDGVEAFGSTANLIIRPRGGAAIPRPWLLCIHTYLHVYVCTYLAGYLSKVTGDSTRKIQESLRLDLDQDFRLSQPICLAICL